MWYAKLHRDWNNFPNLSVDLKAPLAETFINSTTTDKFN